MPVAINPPEIPSFLHNTTQIPHQLYTGVPVHACANVDFKPTWASGNGPPGAFCFRARLQLKECITGAGRVGPAKGCKNSLVAVSARARVQDCLSWSGSSMTLTSKGSLVVLGMRGVTGIAFRRPVWRALLLGHLGRSRAYIYLK